MVIAELQRWQIEIEDSAGQRLSLTPVGRFLQLLCDAVVSDFAPLLVLSLLKHPFASSGMDRRQFRRLVDQVELAAMRGVRPGGGLAGLADALDDAELKAYHQPSDAVPSADGGGMAIAKSNSWGLQAVLPKPPNCWLPITDKMAAIAPPIAGR